MSAATQEQVAIGARFNGPPMSANGGYAAAVVAEPLGSSAAVRLSAPPPLDRPMTRRLDDDGVVRLVRGETLIAEAREGRPAVAMPAPPPLEAARAASERFPGRRPERHPWPGCFVCGPRRAGDGMGIFPGPAGDDGLLACAWTPGADLAHDGVVDAAFVWAALDCPSGFACMPPGSKSVLASMTAALDAPVRAGETYVVTARPLSSEGRKHRAASAIHDADGGLVATAESLWITLR